MTAKEIAQLIESPERCTAEDFTEIVKLADKYPYAQTFPILLLQHLGKTKSMEFEDQLNKHAFKISDRTQLYFLINEGKDQVSGVKELASKEPELTLVPEEVEVEETIIEKVELSVPDEIEIISKEVFTRDEVDIDPQEDMKDIAFVQVEEMTFDPVTIDFDEKDIEALDLDVVVATDIDSDEYETQAAQEEAVVEEEIEEIIEEVIPEIVENAEEFETEVNEKLVEIEEDQETEELEKELVSETIDSPTHQHEVEETSKHEEHAENTPVDETEKEIVEEFIEVEDTVEVITFKPMEAFDPTADILSPKIETQEEDILPSSFEEESKPISLDIQEEDDAEMDEVTSHAIAAGYQISNEEEKIEIEVLAEEIVQDFEEKLAEEKRSFSDWLKVSATTNSAEYQVKQQRSVEIVDRFIKDDPKIKRISKADEPEKKAAEFFKVSTIAKESLNEEVMPVSETLAKIYMDQGNFGKAIDAYNQLLLLNPEKKSFFANQIKKLKKRIKT